jgi:hypothetical protein
LKELVSNARKEIEALRQDLSWMKLTFHKFSMKYGSLFEAGIGAEAIYEILKKTRPQEARCRA